MCQEQNKLTMTMGKRRAHLPPQISGAQRGVYERPQLVSPRDTRYSPFSMLVVRRFFQPLRRDQISDLNIQFDTPFISYDTDLFTVFGWWPLDGLENGIARGSSVADGIVHGKTDQPRAEKSVLQRASSKSQMIPQII
ncbi:hypothetical protein HDV63DRAFT_234296 [Trichoderma sp. SZMC 28014]